jgi:hypothetical protein
VLRLLLPEHSYGQQHDFYFFHKREVEWHESLPYVLARFPAGRVNRLSECLFFL